MASTRMKRPPRYGTPDSENPEWTDEDFARARPAREVIPPALFERLVAEQKRRQGERGLQKAPTKVAVTLRLDPDLVEQLKAGGKGWQTRVNETLRKVAGL
jgi:uncharacterized protein (DUF4415 family)